MINDLQKNYFWDGRTKAMIVDVNSFWPSAQSGTTEDGKSLKSDSSSIFTLTRFVFESGNGLVYPNDDIKSFKFFVYLTDGGAMSFVIAYIALFCLAIFFHILDLFNHCKALGNEIMLKDLKFPEVSRFLEVFLYAYSVVSIKIVA